MVFEITKFISIIKDVLGLINQVYKGITSSSRNIKIEVFPNQIFQELHHHYGVPYRKQRHELSDHNKGTAVSIANYGTEDIRLDEIRLRVFKKGVFRKTKISDVKGEKFKKGFSAEIIPPNGDVKLNVGTGFDSTEKDMLIYEVIAIIKNRKIKHKHIVRSEGDAMKSKYSIYALIIVIGVILDQWTKQLILTHIHGPDDFQHWLPVLSIVRTHNMGVSFGMLSGFNLEPWFYGALSKGIIMFLVYMIKTTPRLIPQLAFVFMISGAIGNLIDRFMHGYVVDFISVHWFEKYYFYVFNVADIFVTCGAGLIILDTLIERRTQS